MNKYNGTYTRIYGHRKKIMLRNALAFIMAVLFVIYLLFLWIYSAAADSRTEYTRTYIHTHTEH